MKKSDLDSWTKSLRKEYVKWNCITFCPIINIFRKLEANKSLRCFIYKINESNCCSRLFAKFIQTQKSYPTSLDKMRILTWRLLVISSQFFSCELTSQNLTPFEISHICHGGFNLCDAINLKNQRGIQHCFLKLGELPWNVRRTFKNNLHVRILPYLDDWLAKLIWTIRH